MKALGMSHFEHGMSHSEHGMSYFKQPYVTP